jgi:uncharacterized protein (DUF362 family)
MQHEKEGNEKTIMPMTKVILKKSTYDYNMVKAAFFENMETIGGDLIGRGDRVLIKPNML